MKRDRCLKIAYFLWMAAVLVATVGVWRCFPEWLTGGESASTTIRNLGIAAAALLGLPLAIWRSAIAEREVITSGHNLSDERFKNGVELLGRPERLMRVSGVFILARIAKVRPELYHVHVMDIFAEFLTSPPHGAGGTDGQVHLGDPDTREIIDAINNRTPNVAELERNAGFDWEKKLAACPQLCMGNGKVVRR